MSRRVRTAADRPGRRRRGWRLCRVLRNFRKSLADAGECFLPSQHLERLKQRWGILPAADRNADWLEHLAGLDPEFLRGCTQSLVERVVLEFYVRQHLARFLEHPLGHRSVAFLGNQFSRIIRWQLI